MRMRDIMNLVEDVYAPVQPQHHAREFSDAFRNWFGDSKIVDEEGNPRVMYHGTTGHVTAFDPDKIGKTDHGFFGVGFSFSADVETANGYSQYDNMNGSNVVAAYLSVQNPYVWPEGKQAHLNKEDSLAFTNQLKAWGHDGIIYNMKAFYPQDTPIPMQEVVVFSPNQIKSIYNKGNWAKDNNDISEGIVQRQSDLAPVLYHGTDVFSLAWILASDSMSNSIDTQGHGPNAAHGVSLTFNNSMAWSFASRSTDIWVNNHWHSFAREGKSDLKPIHMEGAVIEFDGIKLAQKYRIERYDDVEDDDEDEERVLTPNGIKPVSPFIRAYYVAPEEIDFAIRYVSDPNQWEYEQPEHVVAALNVLKHHPLRREP